MSTVCLNEEIVSTGIGQHTTKYRGCSQRRFLCAHYIDAVSTVSCRRRDFTYNLLGGYQNQSTDMIDNNLGVTPVANYEVKRVDSDFFIEE